MTSPRLHSIDFLRGVAALTVCLGHAVVSANWRIVPGSWFHAVCQIVNDYGGLGVPLFFVISGFCIHLNYARGLATTGRGPFRFAAFWKRRMWRLYPTYFLVLCASMLMLVALYLWRPTATMIAAYPEPKPRQMVLDFLAHATMLHGFWPIFDHGAGNPPFWTLAREEYLYLLYPVLLLFRARLKPLLTAALVTWLGLNLQPLIITSGLPLHAFDVIWTSVLPAWIQWYLGCVAAEAYCGLVDVPWVFRSLWTVPVYVAVSGRSAFYGHVWIGVAFFTLINACVRREQLGRWSERSPIRAIVAIGAFSYSLYLVHSPVQTILLSLLLTLGPATTSLTYSVRAAVMIAGSLLIARLLFVAVESRFLYRRGLEQREPQPALAAADALENA